MTDGMNGEVCQGCGEIHGDDLDELVLHLIRRARRINPRVAFVVDDQGGIHFAANVAPDRAAFALRRMADRVERNGGTWQNDYIHLR